MLAQDRFETETPNVIDPGECPPSHPGRNDESSEESCDGIMRGSDLPRHDNKHSLYTRNGNKGALSKGIPLRFVLSDTFSDEDSFSEEQEIVFEKREVPYFDENHTDFQYDTKSIQRFLQDDDDDDDDEEENGIAQARLFAAAMLNESNRRSTRDLGIRNTRRDANPLHQMIRRASSFRNTMANARASSIRSLGHGSSHHSIPLDSISNRSASSKKSNEKQFNIWLVDDDDVPTKLSKTSLLWKKLVCSTIGLLIAIIVLTVYGVTATRSQPSVSEGSNPVALSNDNRLDEIVHYLSETTGISSLDDFKDASSPQSMAALWLAYEDSEKLDIPTIETRWAVSSARDIASPFDFVQRYVLLVLYFALGGDDSSWTKDYHFASQDRHECSWFERVLESGKMTANRRDDGFSSNSSNDKEIDLSNSNENSENIHYFAMGVSCDRDLKVQSIFLPSNNLKGSIPSEIQYLSSLRSLNLGNNSIEGSIPEELSNLVHLTYLDLSGNRLTGNACPFYSWVGERWTHLEILDLSDNQLALGGQNTTHRKRYIKGEVRLQTLALSGNIPKNSSDHIVIPDEIRTLTNLRELYLDNSNIGGRIPAWIFHELSHLQLLDVSHNQLTGSISGGFPTEPLQNMEFLLLHDNPLTGTLPESIGYMSSLTTITIHHTNMTVGTDAANLICWHAEESSLESSLESLTTDCGDATCPCCIENCCDDESCYPDVDWHSGISSSHQQAQDNRVGNEN